jgi:hypothetical protein
MARMDEERLREIELQVAVGVTLPGRNLYALETLLDLTTEVRRLRGAVEEERTHKERVVAGVRLVIEEQSRLRKAMQRALGILDRSPQAQKQGTVFRSAAKELRDALGPPAAVVD